MGCGAREAIRYLNDAGYLTVVVTNQSGIGRGYYTGSSFALHRWIDRCLRESGAHRCRVLLPAPDAALPMYRKSVSVESPRPGMLHQAIRELDIDQRKAF